MNLSFPGLYNCYSEIKNIKINSLDFLGRGDCSWWWMGEYCERLLKIYLFFPLSFQFLILLVHSLIDENFPEKFTVDLLSMWKAIYQAGFTWRRKKKSLNMVWGGLSVPMEQYYLDLQCDSILFRLWSFYRNIFGHEIWFVPLIFSEEADLFFSSFFQIDGSLNKYQYTIEK